MEPTSRSYVCGTAEEPLRFQTVGETLDEAVRRFGDREALVVRHQGVRLDYRSLARRVDDVAAGLLRLGLRRGDRIGIFVPNNLEWVLVQLATARLGLVLVNVNPAYRIRELEYALRLVGCRALVTARRFRSSDYLAMLGELLPELGSARPGRLRAAALPELRSVVVIGSEGAPGCLPFDALAAKAEPSELDEVRALEAELEPDDPINIQFTSGTTGSPKGATLSHFNIVNNALFVGRALRLSPDDRMCIPVPLYHCFGMVLGNLACIVHGATMVQPAEVFDPGAVLETVEAERCTVLHGVPTMFIAELEHPRFRDLDLSSLRTGIMAGSPCPIEVMRRVIDEMGMREVTIAYGMTETSPVSFQSEVDDPVEVRVATVGRVHPHVQARVVDEAGRTVPRGVPGELLVRGYSVMLGYFGDEAQTRATIDGAGWLHTGDLAVLEQDGTCRIVGRRKDLVIRGGENIHPREVEEFLHGHPDVLDVQVFGVPDPRMGEELCAWVIPREGATLDPEALRAWCRGRIAHYKIPRHVRLVESFPLTVTGKVQKFRMREAMIRELGLREADTAP